MARRPRNTKPKSDEPFNGADPAAFDHDGDGEPGGSKPIIREVDALKPSGIYKDGELIAPLSEVMPPTTIPPHEFTALCAEAYEAYDYQDERLRFDTLGRRWWFVPDKQGVNSVLRLQVKRLEDVREDTISTALLASDLAAEMIADVVKRLDEGLR